MRSVDSIQKEIVEKFGFFPPFFAPALHSPALLENLWQQTLLAYVENPIPNLFKEKLAALCARYCAVPYCLVCHSSTLRPLGLKASQVLDLLETPPLNSHELVAFLDKKLEEVSGSANLENWPEEDSPLEEAILISSLSVFLQIEASRCLTWLKKVLNIKYFDFLTVFISYNRTCLSWAEAHPELSYEADKRVLDHLGVMIQEEPKLANFFENYHGKRQIQANQREAWLTEENRRLLENERIINDSLKKTVVALNEEKKVRQKFVDALTHDLRTPLSSIQLNLQMLNFQETNERRKTLLTRCLKNVTRLDYMIQNLLDVSRIQGGQGPSLKKEKGDLKDLLEEVVENHAVEADNRLTLKLDEGELKGCWDSEAIKRIVENLISNAIKYGNDSTPITIRAHRKNEKVIVSIHNFGKELSDEGKRTIFIPFQRLGDSTQKGWGIGLTVVKSLVEEHGGSLDVRSQKGETVFFFDLPLL